MKADLEDVQRIVLRGTPWLAARHLLIGFDGQPPLHGLARLLQTMRITAAGDTKPTVQFSLGFTRRGLEGAAVPDHVLACFAMKSPAFWAGAAKRAAGQLGLVQDSAPDLWAPGFAFEHLDAVLSLHGDDERVLARSAGEVEDMLKGRLPRISVALLPATTVLPPPEGLAEAEAQAPAAAAAQGRRRRRDQWVHFGFLDGLSRVGIRGATAQTDWQKCDPSSRHEAGEFVLGHAQDSGANPWVAGPGLRVWPEEVRSFFHNGSFGVLQQVQQDVAAFERYVTQVASAEKLHPDEVKAKLCGRTPAGRPLAVPHQPDPHADFGYAGDPDGHGCPFGSHIRRMNPRLHRPAELPPQQGPALAVEGLAHFRRSRPLLRRGMPYGPAWNEKEPAPGLDRGLIGQFFCASIEDQFEHLLGQWAERVPIGSPDGGGARDPLIGAHGPGDGPFEIPQPGHSPRRLHGLRPFTRTRGVAYLFYPSLTTLEGLVDERLWLPEDKGGQTW